MKKLSVILVFLTIVVAANAQQTRGTLKLFYTNKTTTLNYIEEEYKKKVKKGELVAVVNSFDKDALIEKGSIYQLTVPAGSVTETFTVMKADVDMKTYNYSPLPVSRIGNGMYFKSKDGLNARVFKSNSNGHKYIGATKDDVKFLGTNINSCYVLSVECIDENGSKYYTESPIPIENGNVLSDAYFFFQWASGDGLEKPCYDQAGRLLCDLRNDFAGRDYVAAYIGSENALYFEGKLYYYTDMKSSVAAPTTSAISQTLDDLPIADILKLVDYRGEAGDILNKIGYKHVGNYGNAQTRTATDTWSRNCIASKSGQVRQFQNGTSSIVCVHMRMMDWPSLTIEVFNVNARNLIVKELKAKSFVEQKGSNDNQKTFIRKDGEDEVTADMEKSPKGWKFRICPIELGLEEYESSSSRVENNNGSPKVNDSGSTKIYEVVEYQPSFPGGQQNLMVWLSNHITYPDEALIKKIQGRVVVSLIVETDGSISNVNVIQGVDPLLDAEAKRVVSAMPKWNPGYHKGEAVRVRYNIPITFKY